MEALTRTTTAWAAETEQSSQKKTYTFQTAGKYVDKNIELTVRVPDRPSGSYNAISVDIGGGRQIVEITDAGSWNGGIDTYDATATADDLAVGMVAYARGMKLIGTVEWAENCTF